MPPSQPYTPSYPAGQGAPVPPAPIAGYDRRHEPNTGGTAQMDGWLIGVESLHARRAPGNTCLSALRGATMGTVDRPLNNSKGCGGVMRVAPIGLAARDEEAAFALGCEAAAITHGHPSGYYSAGCFAAVIQSLTEGRTLPDAVELLPGVAFLQVAEKFTSSPIPVIAGGLIRTPDIARQIVAAGCRAVSTSNVKLWEQNRG